jgi:hypothetical protein
MQHAATHGKLATAGRPAGHDTGSWLRSGKRLPLYREAGTGGRVPGLLDRRADALLQRIRRQR